VDLRNVVVLIIAGAAWLALIVGGFALARRRRSAGRAVVGVGLVWLVVFGWLVTQQWQLGADHHLWANGLTGQSQAFQAEVAHSRLSVSGLQYAFRVGQSRDELFAQLSATYPSGRVVDDTWSVIVGGLGYSVAPDPSVGSNGYLLAADVVGVSTPAVEVYVPVPHDVAVQLVGIEPTTPFRTQRYPVALDAAGFRAYYESLGTVREIDGSFVVPDSAGGYETVTVRGGMVSVSLDTFPTT
jgi:hypothetical protein